jgi:PAS domain S-box-containing protein
MQRLLIAGSERLRDAIAPTLRNAGYALVIAYDDHEVFRLLKQETKFDLVLSDIQIPETLEKLQNDYPAIPVMILAENATIEACVQAIRYGAVNFVPLPVDGDTLLAKVSDCIAYFLKLARTTKDILQVRELKIDRLQSTVHFRSTPLQLTPIEYAILCRLAQDAGNVVTLEDIVKYVYEEEVTRSLARKMLTTHLTNLRSKMQKAGCEHYLVNIFSKGYYLDTNVEEKLRQAEDKLRLVLEQFPGNVWTTDRELKFTWVAGTRRQELEITREQIVEMTVAEVLGDEPEAISITSHKRALEGESVTFEREWRDRYYHCHIEPLRDADGSIVGCIGVSLDLSERKRAEERSAFQANVLSQVSDVVIAVDMQGQLTYWNHAAERWFGIKLEDMLGRSMRDAFSEQWISSEDELRMATGLWENGSWQGELVAANRDGERADIEISISWLKDGDDNPIGILTLMRDVSERKKAERELAAERTLLRTLIDNMPDYIYVKDLQSRFVVNNIASAELMAATPEEILGKNDFDYAPRDLAALYYADEQAVIQSGTPLLNHEEPVLNSRTDQEIWVLTTKVPLRDSQGNITGIVGIGRDITERKQADEALRQSEQRFRATFEQAAVGVTHTSPDGKWLRINQKMCDILGYTREELMQLDWQMVTHPDDMKVSLERTGRLLAGEIKTYSLEKRYIRKDGSPVWVNLTSSPVRDSSGIPEYYVAVLEDITERKRAEALLRESELRYRSIFENALEGIYRSIPGRRITDANPAMARILGYESPAEVMALNIPDDLFVDPAEWEHLQALHQSHDIIEGVELRWKRKDGETIVVGLYVQTLRDEAGLVMFYEGIVTNITERKQAEEKLHLSEERYRIISEMMSDYVYAVRILPGGDYLTSLEWVAGALEPITGYTVEEALSGIEWAERAHPDDAPIIKQRRQKLLAGEKDISEFRMVNKRGETYWLRAYNQPIWDDKEGRVVRVYAAVQNITERKQIEEALVTERNRLQTIIETVPDQIYVKNLDSEFTLVNHKTWELHRMSGSDELLGKTDLDIFGEEGQADFLAEKELFATGKPIVNQEHFTPEALGGPRWSLVTKAPHYDAENKIVGLVGVNRDITERKRFEEALQQSEERYRAISETMSDYVYAFHIEPDRKLVLEWIAGAYEQITGYTVKEVFGGVASVNIIHPDDQALVAERTERLLSGQSDITECRLITRSGEIRYIRLYGSPVWDAIQGRLVRVYASAEDITERKRTEEALRKSEKLYHTLVSNLPKSAIVLFDHDLRHLIAEGAALAPAGFEKGLVEGRTIWEVLPAEIAEAFEPLYRAALKGEENIVEAFDYLGRVYYVHLLPVKDEDGNVFAGMIVVQDITEKKQAEDALRASEANFRKLVDDAPAPMMIFRGTKVIFVNAAIAELSGYSREEWLTMNFYDVIVPEQQPIAVEKALKRQRGEQVRSRYEVKIFHKSGRAIWLDYMATAIQFEGETAVLAIVADITQRKETEQILRQSEAAVRALIQSIPAPLLIFDENRMRYVNPAAAALIGYTPEEVCQMTYWDMIHPDMREFVRERGAQRIQGGAIPPRYEVKLITRTGESVWVDYTGTTIQYEGKPAVLGIVFDITGSKQTEAALRQSEESFRIVLQNMPILVDAFDEQGNIVFWNRECEEVTGYSSDEIAGNPSAMQLLYPNPAYLTEHLEEWNRRGDNYRDWEWDVVAKDGSTKTIAWSNISAHFPVPGFPTWGIGVDVTARKEAQQALRQSEEQLRNIIANAPLLVWAVDREGVFTLFQGRGTEVLGLGSHQIVGRSIYESNRHDVQQHIERAFAGQIFNATLEIYGVVFETHYAPIYDAAGEIVGIMGISMGANRHE